MSHENAITKEGKFEFLEKGEGHTIIILHGLFGALSNFNEVIDQFSQKYKVVVPLMPLYDSPLLKTSVGAMAEFINEFIKFKNYNN